MKSKMSMMFDDEVLEFINEYSENKGVKKMLVANEVIKRYMNNSQEIKTFSNTEKIKQSMNFLNVNISVLIEALNSQLISDNIENVYTTDMMKAPALDVFEKSVEKQIKINIRKANKRG